MDPREFEENIIELLFRDKEARDKLLPFLDPDIFDSEEHQSIVTHCIDFQTKFQKFPKVGELKIAIKEKKVFEHLTKVLNKKEEFDGEFIKGEVENFIKHKLLWKQIIKTTEGLNTNDTEVINSAADRIRESLTFSFDTSIGIDILEDGERLYNSLHETNKVVSTGIPDIDKMIDGGFHEKTLTLFMGETNIGKTLTKCAIASNCLLDNKKVLYVTLEMSEEKISERIVANIFDIEVNNLKTIPKDRFLHKLETISKTLSSKLVVKEFPSSSINTNRLRSLLKDLETKKDFKPDIVFVDMVDIMLPNRLTKNVNTNTELKNICSEIRGLATETGIPFVSSRQINRDGYGDAQIDLKNSAESIGTTTVADIIFGITQTEELREARKYLFILLKNRSGINKTKCTVTVNYSKMRLSNNDDEDNETNENSATVVDQAASKILNTLTTNKKTERNKILEIDMGDD
jgi:replicative DNA helicase